MSYKNIIFYVSIYIIWCAFFSPGKIAHVQRALAVVLDLLDYTCWRRNLDVWQRLKDIINKLQIQYM